MALNQGQKNRIAEMVRHMVEHETIPHVTSSVVEVRVTGGRLTMFLKQPHVDAIRSGPRRRSIWWDGWMFCYLTHTGVWAEQTNVGDIRDEVRDVVLDTLRAMGLTYLASEDRWMNLSQPAYMGDGMDSIVNLSTSMETALRTWADEYDCKVSRMFFTFTRSLGDGQYYPTYESMFIEPLRANYLTIREDGTISYLPAGKYESAENPWGRRSAGRQDARPARLIRSMLKPEALATLTDKDWEAFASRIKGEGARESMHFELVDGEAIREWYHEENYDYNQHTGDLANSCMRYSRCQRYFDVYVRNPDQCKMLIAKDPESGLLIGRALVWTTTDGTKVHDRIYGNEGTRAAFRDWFLDNDIRQAASDDRVALDNPWHRRYPYFDTFSYIDSNGVLHSRYTGRGNDLIGMGSTDGGSDLSAGPPICKECGLRMGWGSGRRECNGCRDRRQREERERWIATSPFASGPPASFNYDTYRTIPSGIGRFENIYTGERYQDVMIIAGRYEYAYNANAGMTGDLFTFIRDREAPEPAEETTLNIVTIAAHN